MLLTGIWPSGHRNPIRDWGAVRLGFRSLVGGLPCVLASLGPSPHRGLCAVPASTLGIGLGSSPSRSEAASSRRWGRSRGGGGGGGFSRDLAMPPPAAFLPGGGRRLPSLPLQGTRLSLPRDFSPPAAFVVQLLHFMFLLLTWFPQGRFLRREPGNSCYSPPWQASEFPSNILHSSQDILWPCQI